MNSPMVESRQSIVGILRRVITALIGSFCLMSQASGSGNDIYAELNQTALPFVRIDAPTKDHHPPEQLGCATTSLAEKIRIALLRATDPLSLQYATQHPSSQEAHFEQSRFCGAEYLPLGQGRYLVDDHDLLMVDLKNGTHSALALPVVDDERFLGPFRATSDVTLWVYREYATAQGSGYVGYWLFAFTRERGSRIGVQYVQLDGAMDTGDADHKPMCIWNEDDPSQRNPSVASSIFPPTVQILPRGKVLLRFHGWSEDCAKERLSRTHARFTYAHGYIVDQGGNFLDWTDF